MAMLIYQTFYLFFVALEIILVTYVLMSWLPLNAKLREFMNVVTAPILEPIRYLLKHSIFYSQGADLSPIVGFVIVSYMQQLFYIQTM